MADDFERFLAVALSRSPRGPDREFVARVQALVLLDERLKAERRSVLGWLAREMLALAAVTAALLIVAASPAVATFTAESPAAALGGLVAALAFLVLLLCSGRNRRPALSMAL